AKGGVASLTLPLAREFSAFAVRVVTIAPGLFDTPMLHGLPEQARADLCGQAPFPKRLGHPEEFAALVCHIYQNPMLNGTVIRLDGGLRLPGA
ncbi:MAG: SDR family oxidoreductase, partial [Gammaproteobacteria bacterium]